MLCHKCQVVLSVSEQRRPRNYRKEVGQNGAVNEYTLTGICDGCHQKELESGATEVQGNHEPNRDG